MSTSLISLNLEQPTITADYESSAPTGASLKDIKSMEQFLIGLKTHTGQVVTPEKARRCSAVLACMRGISEDLSALPLKLYKRTPHGDEEDTSHSAYSLLNTAPNNIHTAMDIREHIIMDLMLWGNFYVLKNEDPNNPGDVESIWPLQAGYVARRWREAVWTYSDPLTGGVGDFTPDTVWRGSILSSNSIDGIAITTLAREAIGLLLAAEEQGARLFSYGVQTDLTLTTPESLDDDEKKQLREAFMLRHSGSGNAWLPLILEGGLDAKRIGLTAQESQYIETRKFQIEDIARVFRYPEVLLGNSTSGKASTYASAEQFFQSYQKYTLNPWATRLEQTANRDLLMGKDKQKYFFRHDFSSLLRGDTAARYSSYAIGINSGFLSPADIRKKENEPFVPGLDYYIRALNTQPTAGTDAAALAAPADAEMDDETDNDDPKQSALPRRLAAHILQKEHRALTGGKQDANAFYANFGSFVIELTGADSKDVLAYLESRRTTEDRFTPEAYDMATETLISLCKG